MTRPIEAALESLKQQVHDFWNARPCGTQFTELEWGSRTFFDAVEQERYLRQPFIREAVGFDRYRGLKLLEIGCGLGTDSLQFARGGAVVTAVDLTEQSIELARRRFPMSTGFCRGGCGCAGSARWPRRGCCRASGSSAPA